MTLILAVTVVAVVVATLALVLWLVPYPEDGEPLTHRRIVPPRRAQPGHVDR